MQELVNSDWTWDQAIELYEDELVFSERHAETSIRGRISLLNRVKAFASQNHVDRPELADKKFLINYFKSRKIVANTKETQIRYLTHFFDFLVDSFVVLENAATLIPVPKVKKKEVVIPMENEIQKVYQAILKKNDPLVVLRDLIIVDLLLNPGLRVSELARLVLKDIFLDANKILVVRKGGDQQILPINEQTTGYIKELIQLRDYPDGDQPLLLSAKKRNGVHNKLSIRGIQDIISSYMQNNFLLNKKTYGPHLLRHTAASFMLRGGVDVRTVQGILNHKDIKTTMQYVHTDMEQMEKAVAGMKRFDGRSK